MKKIILVALVVGIYILGFFVSDKIHKWGQTSKFANDVVMTLDMMDFVSSGGGFFGASNNYFGWQYAKATNNPNRSWLHKILFWPNPFYLTSPQEEWPYEFPFEKV